MTSADLTAPLRMELRRSLRLAVLLLLLHGGALLLAMLVPLVWWAKSLLVAAIVASFIETFITYALLRGKRAIRELVSYSDGRWSLRRTTGEEFTARLLPGAYVHPQLIILTFQRDEERWRRSTVVLLRDTLDATSLRRLRMRLNLTTDTGKPG